MPRYDLFGGAITVDLPQAGFIDASELRQVPDTQEVLLSPDSDLSIILEVLELVREGEAATDNGAAVRFHFDSLAHDNSALSSSVDSISLPPATFTLPSPPSTPHPTSLVGSQRVAKFNLPPEEADDVDIRMALWRLTGVGNAGRGTDLVLTINQPVARTPAAAGPTTNGAVTNWTGARDFESAAEALFAAATRTLRIVDWGLFA